MKKNSLFDNWFVYNYQRLRNIFGRYLHEDAFHDAYLAMKREVVISEIPVGASSLIFSACTKSAD